MADENSFRGTVLREHIKLRNRGIDASFSSDPSFTRVLHYEKDAELIELEKEYKKLKLDKQELEKRVEEAALINELQQIVKNIEETDDPENVPLGQLADNDILFKAIELTKRKKLEDLYKAYRLTGISGVLLKKNLIRFCLDTCFKGKYFEPYYMEIHLENENFKILKHTIPFFIPVDEIVQKYKDVDGLKEFIPIMSSYLNSFVGRREQFLLAQVANEHYIIEDFYSTPAFNFAKFTLKILADPTQSFAVKMKYTDLKDQLPTEVDVTNGSSQTYDKDFKNNLQENLLSMDVKEAILAVVLPE